MSNKPDIVIHQRSRGPRAPGLSPFAVKLETFVRMADLPYTNCFGRKMSPKGKTPWMKFNGEVISDSQFCIDELKARLGVDLNKHLTPEQKGMARAFEKMAEENLYWCMVLCRWVYDDELKEWLCKAIQFPRFLFWYVRRLIRNEAYAQGVGRHSYDEVLTIMESDLKALSDFLEKYSNLGNYCETMKKAFWPDWEECITDD